MYAIGQYGFSPAIENELQISNFAVLLPDVIIMDRKVQERALDYFERGVETIGRKIDCGSQPVDRRFRGASRYEGAFARSDVDRNT